MGLRAIGMGILFALIWSSAFTSARIIVTDAPPLGSLALRFFFSGLIGVAIARALGQSWRLSREQWRATFIFGLCQNALYLGLNFVAMQTIGASMASIVASTMPLIVAMLGWMVFGHHLKPLAYVGLLVGFGGVFIIMGGRLDAGLDLFAVGLCGIGALALAVATLAVRNIGSGGNLLMIVGLQMFVGSAVLAIASALLETHVVNFNWRLGAAFTYTVIFPGLLATWIWFKLVGQIGAVRASSFHFLNPFFGVAIAAALLGEAIGPLDLLGVVVITVGIIAVQISKRPDT